MTGPELAHGQPGDDPEERDPGPARERTSLAWLRTAIAFAALGGSVIKAHLAAGAIIFVMAAVVWQLGRASRSRSSADELPRVGAGRLFAMTVSILAVCLIALGIAIFGDAGPGILGR